MKTVFVLIDHPNLDYLLLPVIEEIRKTGRIETIVCVCNAGKAELLQEKRIPFTKDLTTFNQFLDAPGKKLFLNAADMEKPGHRLGWEMDEMCRKKGIPSLSVEHAAHSMYGKIGKEDIVNADRIALAGACEFEAYLSLNVPPEKLVITGSPKYDAYYHLIAQEVAESASDRRNCSKTKPYILLAGANHGPVRIAKSHTESQWTAVIKDLLQSLLRNYPNFDILIKPHPAEPFNDTEKIYKNAVSDDSMDRVRFVDAHSNLSHAILKSELVVSFTPSVMLEALLLKRPVVLFSGLPKPGSALEACVKAGALIVPSKWNEIGKNLDEKLTNPLNSRIHLSDEFLERYVHRYDGKASSRIVFLIEKMLEKETVHLNNGVLMDWKENIPVKRPIMDEINFERYQRLMGIAEEVLRNNEPPFSLLDVGSEDEYFKKFVPNADYHSFDGIISSKNKTFLPYPDASFDIVTAADVFEHVFPKDRKLFIYELLRVAKRRLIISFPNALSAQSEQFILSLIPECKWLREHQENGLPGAEAVEMLLNELGLSYKRKSNSSLATWIYSILFDFISLNRDVKKRINGFLQENFFETENKEPAYRYIYTIDMVHHDHREELLFRINRYLSGIEESAFPEVSIIIPVFNQVDLTKQCVGSVVKHTSAPPFEIIIVDNGSTDETGDYLNRLGDEYTVIKNRDNRGFAKACNQGARIARGNYLLFLNNDTKARPGWLESLVKCIQADKKRGIVGAKLLYPDDTIQHAGVGITDSPHPIYAYHVHHKKPKDAPEVNIEREYQAVTAACMLIRKTLFDEIGEFDENFLNGYEDVDLCFRARQAGNKVVYCPSSELYHFEASSAGRFQSVEHNIRLLHKKWLGKISPDEKTAESVQTGKMTSIVILAFNQLQYTRKCIESIFRHTKQPFELIVVDNGSTDGTLAYLESVAGGQRTEVGGQRPEDGGRRSENEGGKTEGGGGRSEVRVEIIANQENRGFAAGNNQGIAAARGDYILLMNNDIVVTPDWLERMISCAEKSPQIGMVGPMSNYASGRQIVENVPYNLETLEGLERFAGDFSRQWAAERQRSTQVVGFCMLIKRAVINRIGGLDERYGLGNFEDDDFSLRATLAGFESWIAKDCFVHHFGSRTFIGAQIDYAKSLHRNWEIFKKKWDLPAEMPYGSYPVAELLKKGFIPQKHFCPLPAANAFMGYQPKEILESGDKGRNETVIEKDAADRMFSILIPCTGQSSHLEACIKSIESYTPELHEILFLEHGDAKSLQALIGERLKQHSNYHLLNREAMDSPGKILNRAIGKASGQYFLLLSEDMVVTNGWLSGLFECLQRDPDAGVVGPLSNFPNGRQKAVSSGSVLMEQADAFSKVLRKRNRHLRIPCNELDPLCLLFSRRLWREMGPFDAHLSRNGETERDFCFRVFLEGRKHLIAGDVYVHCQRDSQAQIEKRPAQQEGRHAEPQTLQGKNHLTATAVEKGLQAYQRDELDGAIDYLLEAIRQSPANARAYFQLVEIFLDTKNFKDALNTLNQMPPLENGFSGRKTTMMGYSFLGMDRIKEALEYAERALSFNAQCPFALNLMGELQQKQGKEDAAAGYYKKAIQADPGYGLPYSNLGKLVWKKHHENAIVLFEKGFILSPHRPQTLFNYHSVITRLKQFERARSAFETAVSAYPFNKMLRYRFIDVLIRGGSDVDALNQVEESMTLFGFEDGLSNTALRLRERIGQRNIPREKTHPAGRYA